MSSTSAAIQKHSVNFVIDSTTRNTYDNWHFVPSERPVIAPPEVKENYVDLPGANGFLDLTEVLTGAVTYGPRTGTLEFMVESFKTFGSWAEAYSTVLDFLHGKAGRMILDDDPDYYYEGRFTVDPWKSEESWSTISINYRLKPYKTHLTTGVKRL